MWQFLGRCAEAVVITVVTIVAAKVIEDIINGQKKESS